MIAGVVARSKTIDGNDDRRRDRVENAKETMRHVLAVALVQLHSCVLPSAGDRCCSDKPAWRAGLARDRLTPTGQARGIVEASNAQGSPVTAIDILLEPDTTMVQHAQADNARLLKAYPDGFALDATHHPHITMLQQFVRTADLGKVYTAANRILASEKVTSWNLKAFKYYYIPVPPKGIAGIVVEPTENLLRLQQALLDAVAPFTERTGTAAAFVSTDGGRDIQQGLIDYVANFTTVASGKKFNPHITIGVAPVAYLNEMLAEPFQTFTFSPVGASVYQLGSFGAARKELQALSLTPGGPAASRP